MRRNLYLILALLFVGSMQLSAQQMVVVAGESSNTHWEYPYDDAKITFSDGQMLFHLKGKVTNTYNIKDIERIYFFVYDAAVDAMPTAETMSYSSHKEEVSINANPGTLVTIYHANGAKAISHIQTIANAPISVAHLPAGAYVVVVGGKTLKFVKR